jgi:TonB family protein
VEVPPGAVEVAVEAGPQPFRASARGASVEAPRPRRDAPAPRLLGGSRAAQNLSADNPGEGGDRRSVERGRLLAARADALNLDPRLLNTLDHDQEQRIRTAPSRASPQDDRRTPNPDADPWLATGGGILLFRAPTSPRVPAVGAVEGERAWVTAGTETPVPTPEGLRPRPEPGARRRVGAGIQDELRGCLERAAGPVRTGRPPLEEGHASTTAEALDPRPRDDQSADLRAASLVRSFVAASLQDGPVRAPGVGGAAVGGAPGSGGGVGRGGSARPVGDDDGVLSLTSDDARFVRYFQDVRRRLHPLWEHAFPLEDALQLRQGTVILEFVIEGDGAVRAVTVRRRSGVDLFDRNVQSAVGGARLPPIPAALGRARLRVRSPFEYRNPAVR